MKKILLAFATLVLAAPNYAQETFTQTTIEGVEVAYDLIDGETCKTAEETCIDPETQGKITIPDVVYDYAVVGIGDYSFEDCENLTEIVLPATLQWIGERAFYNTGLEKVTFNGHLTSLATGAFNFCSSLVEVYFYDMEPTAINDDFPYSNEGLTLYVPAGTKELYENTAGWSNFPNIVEMSATGITEVSAAPVVTTRYHNLTGMVSDKPFSGINLVTTTRVDGTTTTTKLLH